MNSEQRITQLETIIRMARLCLTDWQTEQAQNMAASYLDLAVPFDPDWNPEEAAVAALLSDPAVVRELADGYGLDIVTGVPV